MKTLQELEPNDCRFPIGESPFTFCGEPKLFYNRFGKMAQSSYCKSHHFECIRVDTKVSA